MAAHLLTLFKMLLVGYLYGIKSERRLVQEIQLNIAYRWFCGFELGEKIPDHSTFSKTRVRKWNESSLFQQIFLEIVRCCMEQKLIDGKEMASDGSYIPAEVSRNSWMDIEVEVEQSMLSYHPIRDYLSSLVWDGKERIRFCLRHFLGADADDYTYEALKLFLVGAISRAFQPGCKFEIMLCLVGGQGAGKSTFFRLLAVRDEWFSDDLRKLDDDNVYRRDRPPGPPP